MKLISFLFIKTIIFAKRACGGVKFSSLLHHIMSVTNYLTNSGFYKGRYLLFHISESAQIGGSIKLIQVASQCQQ